MYMQSINHINLAILPLDGTILDLNRYRYNYYHHLCDKKNIQTSKYEFYTHISNMYDMYKDLPISDKIDIGPFNAKIERELFQYLQYKGFKPKEGIIELIEYLHQKQIPVAVFSTHRTKDAVQYLKMINLYNKVHFIIGSDSTCIPLPSTQILETIANHFQVKYENTLVISSFMSLNQAAQKLHMNIIYCEDLIQAGDEEKRTSYKTVKNAFEVLNTLLFDRYEEAELYSSILGINSQMSKDELDNAKIKLEKAYQDDPQIIDLVHRTYAYYISQLNEQNIKDASILHQKITPRQRFTFDDEIKLEENLQTLKQNEEVEDSYPSTESSHQEIHIAPLPSEDEEELTSLLKQINQKEQTQAVSNAHPIYDYDEIKKIIDEGKNEENIYDEDDINVNDEDKVSFLSIVTNIVYIFALSFLILFVGLIFYIAFLQDIQSSNSLLSILSSVFYGYDWVVETCFKTIFDVLHQLIAFIPSYEQHIHHNHFFSPDGMKLFHIFLFNALLIGAGKVIIYFLSKDSKDA